MALLNRRYKAAGALGRWMPEGSYLEGTAAALGQ